MPPSLTQPLQPVYLIYGEEPLLIIEATDAIRAAAKQQGYDERVVLSLDNDSKADEALQGLHTASLFSDKRLIEITLLKYKAEHAAALLRTVQSPPTSSVCVILCPHVDKTQQKSAWFTALIAHVTPIDCKKIKQYRSHC
jgi:DNA polymerase-3 subunit delta